MPIGTQIIDARVTSTVTRTNVSPPSLATTRRSVQVSVARPSRNSSYAAYAHPAPHSANQSTSPVRGGSTIRSRHADMNPRGRARAARRSSARTGPLARPIHLDRWNRSSIQLRDATVGAASP
ncbi:hypothetical protein FEP76_01712 [Burkholderia multivorans]|nr:hypothetical protein [Burkholderia multivorans]